MSKEPRDKGPPKASFGVVQKELTEAVRELEGLRASERRARASVESCKEAITLLHRIREYALYELGGASSKKNRSRLQRALWDYDYQEDKAYAFLESEEAAGD